LLRLNSGGGAGRATEASTVPGIDISWPFQALPADDGRGGRGGGGGGGGGHSRDRGGRRLEPHSAPPITPPIPVKPWAPDAIDESGTWISIAWTQPETWCSEPVKLGFVTFGVEPGAHQSGFVTDAHDGQVVHAFAVVARDRLFSLPVSVRDVVPRSLPDGSLEASRTVHAQLSNGLCTPVPLELRFLHDLPLYHHDEGRARFSLCMRGGTVIVEHVIPYVLGDMVGIVSLGDLIGKDVGGYIGERVKGHDDCRYCKPALVDGDPDSFVYWDGEAWQPAPKGFREHNSLGDKLHGMALWRTSHGVLMKNYGSTEWPEPDVDLRWHPSSLAQLETKLARWTAAINEFWSGAFKLRRDQCAGYDVDCCSHEVRVNIGFVEAKDLGSRGIVITEGDLRAHASAWPLDESDRTANHEFGHHLGNPDEYPGAGSVDIFVNGDGAVFGIDRDSIMGSGEAIRSRHYTSIAQALAKLVAHATGKSFTFHPV
jgi:hypothetical protein